MSIIQKRSMDSGLIESVGAFIYCVKTRRYLFLLRNNTKYAGTWGVVGGKVESDEQIIESLSREIEEELGIEPAEQYWREDYLPTPPVNPTQSPVQIIQYINQYGKKKNTN